jgi:hypothetical protein
MAVASLYIPYQAVEAIAVPAEPMMIGSSRPIQVGVTDESSHRLGE